MIARNIRWWQQNVHQAAHIFLSCDKKVSIFRCNPSIQKQQKQSAKSKEICVSVVSIRFVLCRNSYAECSTNFGNISGKYTSRNKMLFS